MEDAYIINGGRKLTGDVTLSGAKNVALKTIVAALLFDSEVILENIPRIGDVIELLHLIQKLGGRAEFTSENTVVVDGTSIKSKKLDLLHASKVRVSFLFFAPLLYRHNKASTPHPGGDVFIPNPGGCRIGARPINRSIEGMQALGVDVKYHPETGYYEASSEKGIHGTYRFPKPSHTGTELLIMLSVFAREAVTLQNAASEPEIDELMKFLNENGADIKRQGSSIVIKPVKRLTQTKPFRIMSDRNEAVTFAIAAIVTRGDIIIHNISQKPLETFLEKLKEAGCGIDVLSTQSIRFYYKGPLTAVDIETGVHPGFMTDWQPNWAVLMTQAAGVSRVHERVFENRFAYVEELQKLGAQIEFIETHIKNPKDFYEFNFDETQTYQQEIKIYGPTKLHNGVLTIQDLRAGATLAIAALSAEGESIVNGASILDRGYENFSVKIQRLGGVIKRV